MSDTFLWSDPHFGHQNIIRYCERPFSSVEEMNEELVQRYNERVKPEDRVIIAGDFSMREEMVPLYLPRLNGKKELVWGNHDLVFPDHRKHRGANKKALVAAANARYLGYGFEAIHHTLQLDELLVAHMPYEGKGEYDQKFVEWRPVKGQEEALCCGHVHNSWLYKHSPRQINIGCDMHAYYPWSIEEVRAFLKEATNDC